MEDRLLFSRDDLGDLSDMDDEVDMEEIREGMKLVPLPDMYPDMDRDPAAFASFDDILGLQGADDPDPYKSNEEDHSHSHSGEAAKKAAKVAAPEILTGGVLAESGPPPDFSLWTVEDDLLLRNAMEAGAAMEALARGAMRFSRRYTVRELRERWRALLYDSEISSKAAIRMVEAEASFLESMRLMFPNKQKLQDFVHKHRQKSVRDTFYKRKRGLGDDKGILDCFGDGGSEINPGDHDLDMLIDPDDHAFSQMVDLLASGGIGAVIGAFPFETELETLQDGKDELSLESSMSPVMVSAAEKEKDSSEPNGIVEEPEDEKKDLQIDAAATTTTTTPGDCLPSSSTVADNNDAYIILSSDEEDEYSFQKPKRARTGDVQEKFVCSFNTQETDVSAFGPASSPSSENIPSSPEDDGRCHTSEMRSSDCIERGDDETPETSERPIPEGNYTSAPPASVKLEPGVDAARIEPDPAAARAGPCTDNEVEITAGIPDIPPEVESDDEVARFSDVETMILDMDLDPGEHEVSARAESKRFYRQHQMTILRLEQSVNSVMQRYLTRKGAIAILYGYHLKYLMVANEVSIGRRTQGNAVDVDLAQEGPANKVSRKQASIKLTEDGDFHLKNLGKKVLYVNDVLVFTGQRAVLSSSCLIEVGGMRLVFESNRKLTQQRVKEMT